jgi:autophagy-related protein 5
MWLEYEGIPLKWQFPLGVLLDSLEISIENGPVNLKLYVSQIENTKVIPCENQDTLKINYLSYLKEANALKYSKENKVLNLKTKYIDQLRELVYKNDTSLLKEFRNIMTVLSENSQLEKYPVRFVFEKAKIVLTKPFEVNAFKEGKPISLITMKQYFCKVLKEEYYEKIKEKYNIYIHGTKVNETMPFVFYYDHFNYWDNYLYIVLVPKQKADNNTNE